MSERRHSARIEASSVGRVVDAVRRDDVGAVEAVRPPPWHFEWSADAHLAVSDAFAVHHPPGMLEALRRLRFEIRVLAKDGKRAPPSHSCLAVPMPSHVLWEDKDDLDSHAGRSGSTCCLSAVTCALHMRNYGRALEILERKPVLAWCRDAVDACKRGDCEGFQTLFVKPLLSKWTFPFRPEDSLLTCLHGAVSYERVRSVIGLDPNHAVESFFRPWLSGCPVAPAEEQADVLFCAYRDGVDWSRVRPNRLRKCFQPDTQRVCWARFRAPIVRAVAMHLPVEGVPELIASYVPCPLDAFFW